MQPDKSQQLLIKEWDGLYKSKEAKMILVGNVEGYKFHQEGHHYIVYNKTQTDPKDPLKGRQKSVFLPFDSKNANFSNIPNKQILFYLNLDEEEIISKEESHKITENFFDKEDAAEDDQIEGHTHPLIINNSPVCRYDTILSMYPDEELPQVIGTDIVLLLLNTFKIMPNIKIGYDSIGAGAVVNHLHFHLVYCRDLIGCDKLPIESVQRKPWIKSSLINPAQEINLYSVGVVIDEFDVDESYGFILSALKKGDEEIEFAELTTSLSFVFGIISNELMQLNIPHNILFSDNGRTIYIFVRDFCNAKANYGWMQFSGVIVTATQGGLKEEDILLNKKSLRVDEKSIDLLKKNVKKHLSSFE